MARRETAALLAYASRGEKKMAFMIRKLLPENCRDYTACHILCWQCAYKGIMPDSYLENLPNELEQRTLQLMKILSEFDGMYLYYYAEIDGKMAGRLIIGKSLDDDKPLAGEIAAIYLTQEYWGKGFGREMMNFARAHLKRMGYSEIILWVLEENKRAIRFYEKYGFTFDGTKKEVNIGKPLIEVRYTFNLN
jgi:GNAT superfamily N-acetyltransferase